MFVSECVVEVEGSEGSVCVVSKDRVGNKCARAVIGKRCVCCFGSAYGGDEKRRAGV